jgi:hypothetical protein
LVPLAAVLPIGATHNCCVGVGITSCTIAEGE